MIAKIDKLNKSLVSIEYAVTVPLFLVMVTLMFTQVIFRYFLVYDQFRYDMVSSAAQIPMWIVTSFMLAGLVLSALHCLTNIILNLNGYHRTGYDDEPEDEVGGATCSL